MIFVQKLQATFITKDITRAINSMPNALMPHIRKVILEQINLILCIFDQTCWNLEIRKKRFKNYKKNLAVVG